jgi:ABC-type phosphate transport system ATPase subunit
LVEVFLKDNKISFYMLNQNEDRERINKTHQGPNPLEHSANTTCKCLKTQGVYKKKEQKGVKQWTIQPSSFRST